MNDMMPPSNAPIPNDTNSEPPRPEQTPGPGPNPASIQPPARKPSRLLLPARALGGKMKKHWVYFKNLNLSKKQWALLIAGLLILIAGASYGGYKLYQKFRGDRPAGNTTAPVKKEEPPKPTTAPSPLTGVEVAIELTKRPVTGVMIENHPDAQPQSGLNEAGIIFEAIAEGGITRFLALYQEAQPAAIGPVRSARPYFLDWTLPFNASYAHVGGSPQALAEISSLGVRDLDQFANPGAFDRVGYRFSPHNVYTSMAKLDALNQAKGYTTSEFDSLARKPDEPLASPTASAIDIHISGGRYDVHYDYYAPGNQYRRAMGGVVHADEQTGSQLSPDVIVAIVTTYGIASDGQHSVYGTQGGGPVYIFQDGSVTTGAWAKPGPGAQFSFTDDTGQTIKLNAGQTWITFVDSIADVTHR